MSAVGLFPTSGTAPPTAPNIILMAAQMPPWIVSVFSPAIDPALFQAADLFIQISNIPPFLVSPALFVLNKIAG